MGEPTQLSPALPSLARPRPERLQRPHVARARHCTSKAMGIRGRRPDCLDRAACGGFERPVSGALHQTAARRLPAFLRCVRPRLTNRCLATAGWGAQSEPVRHCGGLAARPHLKLREHGRHVVLDRLIGEKQAARDVGIAASFSQQRENLQLAGRQLVGVLRRARARPAADPAYPEGPQIPPRVGRHRGCPESFEDFECSPEASLLARVRQRGRLFVGAAEHFPRSRRRLGFARELQGIGRDEKDRPQPKFDLTLEKGMATVVGRVRHCPVLQFKYTALSHNTIRGAAGAALLNAELMKAEGYLD